MKLVSRRGAKFLERGAVSEEEDDEGVDAGGEVEKGELRCDGQEEERESIERVP